MKTTTFKTAIRHSSGNVYAIKAAPVTLCGIELALHRTPGKTGWTITHPGTGVALGRSKTKDGVINITETRIALKGSAWVLDQLAKQHTPAPPVESLAEYVAETKAPAPKADVAGIVDLIAERVGGLNLNEREAVRTALNSRTGQLKAKSPSAFGTPAEALAAAAWQGLQPNGYKLGIVTIFSLRGEARDLYDKLSKVKWPAAFDKDKAALVAAGVW
jgi:hypothetical protein